MRNKQVLLLICIISLYNIKLLSQPYPITSQDPYTPLTFTPIISNLVVANSTDIHVFPDTAVNQSEISIAVSPANPNNLFIGAITDLGMGNYRTSNGGNNWTGAELFPGTGAGHPASDPTVTYAANGTLHFNFLMNMGWPRYRIFFRRSTNNGANSA